MRQPVGSITATRPVLQAQATADNAGLAGMSGVQERDEDLEEVDMEGEEEEEGELADDEIALRCVFPQ